ncbi:selenide, water dikinase SelD [Bacteroidota bacterium]
MGSIKLTKYSHGSGCGCKIAPKVLDDILRTEVDIFRDPRLLIGNDTRDDAAVYDLDGERVIISTTDFFMPVVDDPFDFGGIASVNAISDIYAMGGTPIMAISILGWPLDKLPPEVAGMVIDGSREACKKAGISLAGGHSIDSPEPIFGLAVTGIAEKTKIKSNNSAENECDLFLTKPIGVGIMTTAQKLGFLEEEDLRNIKNQMLTLNESGVAFANLESVKAMTDVTGFGLAGHLIELCEGSGLGAEINYNSIPVIRNLQKYLDRKAIPGGIDRNYKSYGDKLNRLTENQKNILCDPQTSGGLLVAVRPDGIDEFLSISRENGLELTAIGRMIEKPEDVWVRVLG